MAAAAVRVLTANWLADNAKRYAHPDAVHAHALAALDAFPSLRVKSDVYTYDDGRTQLLLCLHGLLPISFRNASYNFPIALWLPVSYPREPPLLYVVPTSDLLIRPSQSVDLAGKCALDYLSLWARKPETCNLTSLLEQTQQIFSAQPPLYARPRSHVVSQLSISSPATPSQSSPQPPQEQARDHVTKQQQAPVQAPLLPPKPFSSSPGAFQSTNSAHPSDTSAQRHVLGSVARGESSGSALSRSASVGSPAPPPRQNSFGFAPMKHSDLRPGSVYASNSGSTASSEPRTQDPNDAPPPPSYVHTYTPTTVVQEHTHTQMASYNPAQAHTYASSSIPASLAPLGTGTGNTNATPPIPPRPPQAQTYPYLVHQNTRTHSGGPATNEHVGGRYTPSTPPAASPQTNAPVSAQPGAPSVPPPVPPHPHNNFASSYPLTATQASHQAASASRNLASGQNDLPVGSPASPWSYNPSSSSSPAPVHLASSVAVSAYTGGGGGEAASSQIAGVQHHHQQNRGQYLVSSTTPHSATSADRDVRWRAGSATHSGGDDVPGTGISQTIKATGTAMGEEAGFGPSPLQLQRQAAAQMLTQKSSSSQQQQGDQFQANQIHYQSPEQQQQSYGQHEQIRDMPNRAQPQIQILQQQQQSNLGMHASGFAVPPLDPTSAAAAQAAPPPDLLDAEDGPSSSSSQTEIQTQGASTAPFAPPPKPPNPQVIALHHSLHASFTSALTTFSQTHAQHLSRARAAQAELLRAPEAIKDECARLRAVRDVCVSVGERWEGVVRRGEERLEEVKRRGEVGVDEMVCASSIVGNQVINLVAEDNAIEDTLYHLHRALGAGRIDLERFLRTTRVLAEEQFMKRALVEKILKGLPMGMGMAAG